MVFLQYWVLVYLLLVFYLMSMLNLTWFLLHRIFLVMLLGVLIHKLVHKLPCLNALFLRPNVSNSSTFWRLIWLLDQAIVHRLVIKLLLSWKQPLPFHNHHLLFPLHLLVLQNFQVIPIRFHSISLIPSFLLKLLISMLINMILGFLILVQLIIWCTQSLNSLKILL